MSLIPFFGDFFHHPLSAPIIPRFFDRFDSISDWHIEDNRYIIEQPVPGMKKTDVNVKIDNYNVFVSAERKTKNSSRTYTYQFTIPYDSDLNTVEAHVDDGMLTISCERKKRVQSSRSRQIDVK